MMMQDDVHAAIGAKNKNIMVSEDPDLVSIRGTLAPRMLTLWQGLGYKI